MNLTLATLPDPDAKAACIGQHELFDSTDPADHAEAAKLCSVCPLAGTVCRALLEETRSNAYNRANGPLGTWAGELLSPRATQRRPVSRKRLDAEEAMFTDAEALAAHRAFSKGGTSERTLTGERVYQRRMKRAQKARRAAAA